MRSTWKDEEMLLLVFKTKKSPWLFVVLLSVILRLGECLLQWHKCYGSSRGLGVSRIWAARHDRNPLSFDKSGCNRFLAFCFVW